MSRYTQELLALSAQPAAAEQVLRIAGNSTAAAADIARVVETDPALAARVMRLANSPYYGAPRRVSRNKPMSERNTATPNRMPIVPNQPIRTNPVAKVPTMLPKAPQP